MSHSSPILPGPQTGPTRGAIGVTKGHHRHAHDAQPGCWVPPRMSSQAEMVGSHVQPIANTHTDHRGRQRVAHRLLTAAPFHGLSRGLFPLVPTSIAATALTATWSCWHRATMRSSRF